MLASFNLNAFVMLTGSS